MASQLRFNAKFFRQVLTKDARRIVEDRTRAIATGAQGASRSVNGSTPRFFTDFAVVRSRRRFRGAVICTSKDPDRQEAGQKTLIARLRASA